MHREPTGAGGIRSVGIAKEAPNSGLGRDRSICPGRRRHFLVGKKAAFNDGKSLSEVTPGIHKWQLTDLQIGTPYSRIYGFST